MKAKQVLNKIKTALNYEVELDTAKLDDGVTIIEAESLEAGNDVFIVMDEEMIPLAVGDYTLEDGRALVVEKEGVIASIGEAKSEEEAPVEEEALDNDKPKMIVESKIKETYFNKDMKKTNLEEEEATIEEVVESVEKVEEEIVAEATEIINELTPESVSVEDAGALAEKVVVAVEEAIAELPEETIASMMKPKKKYGKNKLESEEVAVIEEAEAEIVEAVAEVVDAETPEEVTPEVAKEIAEVVVQAVEEIVEDAPEELKKQLFKKDKKKLSKVKRKTTLKRIEEAKVKIEKLNAKKRKPASKRITHNPEKAKKPTADFKFAQNRPQTTLDRVMNKLFK